MKSKWQPTIAQHLTSVFQNEFKYNVIKVHKRLSLPFTIDQDQINLKRKTKNK